MPDGGPVQDDGDHDRQGTASHTVEIVPRRGLLQSSSQRLSTLLPLLWVWTRRDLRVRYRQSILSAGWGLILTYAVYLRQKEDTALNAFMLGFGNNSVSLLAGIMVLCTIFSIMPDAADQIVGASNEGLTFIWIPQLFAQMEKVVGRVTVVRSGHIDHKQQKMGALNMAQELMSQPDAFVSAVD